MQSEHLNAQFGIAGGLSFFTGEGGLVMARITTAGAEALVSAYAGQVLAFRPAGQANDLFFLSEKAYYAPGKAIKGGVPVCWPWFGSDPEGKGRPGHGFVRNRAWDVRGSAALADGRIRLVLGLQDTAETRAIWPHAFDLEMAVTVGERLEIALTTRNSGAEAMTISQGLHSYFQIGDVDRVAVLGLSGKSYIDKVDGGAVKLQDGPVTIACETDRVYLDVDGPVTIDDPALGRRIVVTGTGSRSAVVWNPWIGVAASMSDLNDDDYKILLCVETTNAGTDTIIIPAGGEHRPGAVIGVEG
ncbi:MAG: D-hexose-6-phosphate mutarotase [Hyphomicrobiales bacterium]|nr:D-hexose-6-phosphate mutarotase [Hyphomicrobiales bacterium]